MYTNITEAFKIANSKITKNYESRITIGDTILTNDDVINISFNSMLKNDNAFSVGNCISTTCTLTFITPNSIIDTSKQVKIEFGLLLENGLYEYVPYGVFNIANESETDTTTTFTMYDNIVKLDIPYIDEDNLTTYDKLLRIQNQTGVEIHEDVFELIATNSKQIKIDGYSCREVLGLMASLVLGDVSCTRDGQITIKTFRKDDTPNYKHTFTIDDYLNLSYEKDIFKIKTLRVIWEDRDSMEFNIHDTGKVVEINNPLFSQKMYENGNAYWGDDMLIYAPYLEFKGYSMNFGGNILADLGDDVLITNKKGDSFNSYIHNMNINYNGTFNMIIGASGETDTTNSTTVKTEEESEIERTKNELEKANDELIALKGHKKVSNISSKDSSYMVMGDLLICWGSVTFSSITANTRLTQPVTFPKKFAFMPFVSVSDNTSYANQVITTVGDIELSGCNVGLYTASSSVTTKKIFWLAIGNKHSSV